MKMRDYAELIKRLRKCEANCSIFDCENCAGNDCEAYESIVFKDAADAIEELLAAVPRWISVEERLPKTGKLVLLCINCEQASPHTGFLTADGEFWHDVIGDMSRSKWKVTHWMPLPAPPKEVNE